MHGETLKFVYRPSWLLYGYNNISLCLYNRWSFSGLWND